MEVAPRNPPRKQHGQGLGHRRINGVMLDVKSASDFLGETEKAIRARVARRMIPFRRLGRRIIFLRTELEAWLAALEGCSLDEALANQEARQRFEYARL